LARDDGFRGRIGDLLVDWRARLEINAKGEHGWCVLWRRLIMHEIYNSMISAFPKLVDLPRQL
jgi:hypothetical protein